MPSKTSKTRKPTKPAAPPPDELVPIQFRIARSLIEALDEVVEQRRKADPFTPVTRTDIVREGMVRMVTEARGQK